MGAMGRRTIIMSAAFGGGLVCVMSLLCGFALATVPLPDGRAWEMVSPLEKNGGEINGIDGVAPDNGLPEGGIVQAAADGGSITYLSLLAFPASNGTEPKGAPIASQYLSTREPDGWATKDLTPAVSSGTYAAAGQGAPYRAFSSDLLLGLMENGSPAPIENPPLVGAPPRYRNYYVHNNSSEEFVEALLTSLPSEDPSEFVFELEGVTPDLEHAVIASEAALTPEATRQVRRNLYEWAGDQPQHLQPVNVLPEAGMSGKTASGGALLGMGGDESHTVSDDGSQVIWSQPESERLFVREHLGTGQPTTVQIDASRGGEDTGGEGEFKTASSNGLKVFFTDRRRLTPSSTAGRESTHEDLYMFDVSTGRLTDLTVDGTDQGGASVLGVLEASEDGSYVYFVAEGMLSGVNGEGRSPVADAKNLYLWHETATGEGATSFIAVLSGSDNGNAGFHEPGVAHDWAPSAGERTVRLSPDGRHLVFMSNAQLTGYVSAGNEEVYLYNAGLDRLTCVSCNPDGARPVGPSGIPGGTAWRTVGELGTYQSHVLSTDGNRVFFDSEDTLVPQDTNGAQDVYEWEEGGSGTCKLEGGCVFLLSGATSTSESSFVDASANGNDVFFITRAQLVAQDTDQLRDLYDARAPHVSGEVVGFPSSALAQSCEDESCLPLAPSQAVLSSLASATFNGVGDLSLVSPKPAAKKVKTKKRGKTKRHVRKRHVRKPGRRASVHGSHAIQGGR